MKIVGKTISVVVVFAAVAALIAHEAPRLTRNGR